VNTDRAGRIIPDMNTNQTLTGPGGIASRLAPSVAAASQLAESNEMPGALVREMRDSGAFRLLTPTERGGTEAPLTTVLEVYEELGRIDASVALQVWNSNFGFIGALLGEAGNARIWRENQPEPVFANGGTPGMAEVDPDGYRVSGTWRMVSGIAHADWVVLSTLVTEGGTTRMTENGPDFRLVAVPADQVTVKDTWHVSALRATGSNEIIVENVLVSAELAARLDRPARIDRPLYRGFLPSIVVPGPAAIAVGIAASAIDELVELGKTKKTPTGELLSSLSRVQSAIAECDADLSAARELLFSAARRLQTAAEAGTMPDARDRAALRAAMSHAAKVSRRVLVTMYELGSSTSLYTGNALERQFRDGMATLQHFNLAADAFVGAGRVRFGLEPGMPFF
jgi:alkylation response protein AidB-like acyl-CoA dehydrogenase